MILTLLVGNTNTRLAVFDRRRLVRVRVIPSGRIDDYLNKIKLSPRIEGAVMASVVPKKTLPVFRILNRQVPTLLVNSRTPVPLKFNYDRKLLGADRLAVAAGGYARFQRELVIIDFGTAITFNLVNRYGFFSGGPIVPGPDLMLDALAQGTGRLPRVHWSARARTICTRTKPAIQAGVFNLLIGGLSRILEKVVAEAGGNTQLVVGTGGAARRFRRYLDIRVVDQNLASRGLAEIYYFNRRQDE
jgi:type III pantothenate kinase